ncbi:MAG: aminotransferase class V-fold PLP-dependent enzyme, partial [Limnochordales bacterium]
FPGLKGEVLVHALAQRGVYVSTGSACSSRRRTGARVLKAMGLDDRRADGTLRLSLSAATTEEDVTEAAARIAAVAHELREFAVF